MNPSDRRVRVAVMRVTDVRRTGGLDPARSRARRIRGDPYDARCLVCAARSRAHVASGLAWIGAILALQIVWGALVAGLHAGYVYNTFPLIGGSLFPPRGFSMDPLMLNLIENPGTVQWVHRVMGTLLGLAIAAFFIRGYRVVAADARASLLSTAMVVLVLAQYSLGVLTLLLHVPIPLAATHQAMAMILFGTWLALFHRVRSWRPV